MRVLFIMSRSLDPVTMLKVKEEARIYQDLIVSDNPEGYSNLPLKTLSLMNYYLDNCQNSRYLLKVDDDVFVREESFQLKNIFFPHLFFHDYLTSDTQNKQITMIRPKEFRNSCELLTRLQMKISHSEAASPPARDLTESPDTNILSQHCNIQRENIQISSPGPPTSCPDKL